MAENGRVYLVGAGPGDPELLTLKAARLLREADLLLHDDLVPSAIVGMAGAHTVCESVGKRQGAARTTQSAIHARMIAAARAGRLVVRLKGGDPLIFGRAAEELRALAAADIPVEIVPGISAVFAVAAALHLPLTDRLRSARLIFLAAHRAPGEAAAPLWNGALPDDATLAVYMPGRDGSALAGQLRAAGIAAAVPCVAVASAGRPEQIVVRTTVGDLPKTHLPHAPMLLLVGRVLDV